MKKKIYVLILILAIGFAAVSTTLIMRGNTSIAVNENDYNIFFSEAILDDVDKTNVVIDDTRQVINFDTKKLTLEGEKSILDYEVTNNSKQYDASVKINCMVQDERILEFIDLKYSLDKDVIPAGTKANGKIEVELTKAFAEDMEINNELTCSIETNAEERTSLAEEGIKPRTYYIYGFLVDENNEPIKNSIVTTYTEKALSTVTDDRGMFIISGIPSGEYTLYVNNNLSLEEVNTKTKEELDKLSNQKTNFDTKAASLNFQNNYLHYGKVIAGDPVTHDITFDTNGGVNPSFSSKAIEGQGIGFLPSQIHDSLIYKNWQVSGTDIDENTIINEDTTILANYGEGVVKVIEKHFTNLNKAFEYANANNKNSIVVLQDVSLTDNIVTTKDIELNLNEKNINFKDYSLSNSGTLTIRNGNIKASGLNVLTNDNTLNLSENINIEHINNTNEQDYISTITNKAPATLNINNATITTEYSSYVQNQASIKNEGISNITNSNFSSHNAYLLDLENATMTINDSNFDFSADINDSYMIQDSGILSINGGNYTILDSNKTSKGILAVVSGAQANINAGKFDGEHRQRGNIINTESSSILNIGKNAEKVDFIGNETSAFSILAYGELNIPDGTVEFTNGLGIGVNGKITIGSSTTIPTINNYGSEELAIATLSDDLILIRSAEDNRIINANMNIKESRAFYVNEDTKLTIDNINLTQYSNSVANRAINVAGELVINEGRYTVGENNQTSKGLFDIESTGTLTINSGVFDNTYGTSNLGYTSAESTLNIGKKDQIVNFVGNSSNSFTIVTGGDINIFEGTVNASNGHFMSLNGKMTIGTEDTIPTVNGPTGYEALIFLNGREHRIVNGNISGKNRIVIDIQKGSSKLTIDNINFTQSGSTSTSRPINVASELVINDGVFKITEDNQTTDGLINVTSTGTVTINSGVFDNTYGKKGLLFASASSTVNIGSSGKKVTLKNNSTGYFSATLNGVTNIPDGEITIDGVALSVVGKITIGTSTTTPTITGTKGIIDLKSTTEEAVIKNAILEGANYLVRTYEKSKLKIENGIFSISDKGTQLFNSDANSTITIENGQFTTPKRIATISGVMNINGGDFSCTSLKDNSLYVNTTGTLNIGAEAKNAITITNTTSVNQPLVVTPPFMVNRGLVNIYDGTIKIGNSSTILQRLGTSDEEDLNFSDEEKLNFAATVKIYGGRIENNANSYATISIAAGRLEMSNGEVVNTGEGRTIYNKETGTAIQTGGTSLKNYNVTVQ